MDSLRFDTLARVLAAGSSRRTAFGIALGGILGARGLIDAEAKKRKKKKCKKTCGPCRKCKKGKCKPKPNGTGCGGGAVCEGGTCACASVCDTAADCCAGWVCLPNGSCAQTCTLAEDCPSPCTCAGPTVEGPNVCTEGGVTCEDIPQDCVDSSACPHGFECSLANCGGVHEDRCIPLCMA